MKITCNRGALLAAIALAGGVVNPRSPKLALQCLLLDATSDQLTITATDLEAGVRCCDKQVQVDRVGKVLVDATRLRDIVRESIDDALSLELDDRMLIIRGADALFKIATQDVEEFPPAPAFDTESNFQVNAAQFKRLISQTLFAAARENTRYAYSGVLVASQGAELHMVATDGRRLAQAIGELTSVSAEAKAGMRAIVPSKALTIIDKILTDPEETVAIGLLENQIVLRCADVSVVANLVEGQFPPYNEVIPRDPDHRMIAGTADFVSAIRRAALLCTDDSRGVKFSFKKTGAVLSSRSPEAGEATINFACKFEGTDMDIGFNAQFLLEALKVVDTDEVVFEMSAPNRPALLKAGQRFLCVIMPVGI